MICPACRAEYVPGKTECSDCHVALVAPSSVPDVIVADEDAVVTASTQDASVARGWRDVLTAAGVAHRIDVSDDADPKTRRTYLLLAEEPDAHWAAVLAGVVEQQPSVDATEAVRRATASMAAEPVCLTDEDVALFDVPDLLPPPDVSAAINATKTRAAAAFWIALAAGIVALAKGPWWFIVAAIAAAEGIRARRAAAAQLAAWQQASGWEPPTR